jgi:hypothetical protein
MKHRVHTKGGLLLEIDDYIRSKAIRLHCTECLGWDVNPRDCVSVNCALYPFRGKSNAALWSKKPAKNNTLITVRARLKRAPTKGEIL